MCYIMNILVILTALVSRKNINVVATVVVLESSIQNGIAQVQHYTCLRTQAHKFIYNLRIKRCGNCFMSENILLL